MDLASFASIRKGAAEFLEQSRGKLNLLITNAGVMATPESKTVDGFETQFGTNHLGHFLLFHILKSALLASATPEYPSRVVSVTSTGHRFGPIRFDDYNFEKEGYDEWAAYGQSKTANIWFANAIERHFGSQHLHATSVHPGGIATNLAKHLSPEYVNAIVSQKEYQVYFKSPEQGAATQVYAGVGEEWKDKGGKYLSDCVVQSARGTQDVHEAHDDGYAEWAYDEKGEDRLWKESLKMVGLEGEGVA